MDGCCDAVIFFNFMTVVIESDPDFKVRDPSKRPLIIYANVRFHLSSQLQIYLELKDIQVLTSPAYASMVNLVEFGNGKI